MSKTTLILEALFTGADEAEVARRDAIAPKIIRDEWMGEFLKRKDITRLSDGSYDVLGLVDLTNMKFTKLPVKFNEVGGAFTCDGNQLTTLEGSPSTVGSHFWCDNNKLTSLEGGPTTVGGTYLCYVNQLTDLKGAPKTVGRGFSCSYNKLTSLEGAPSTVGEYFRCSKNTKQFTVKEVRAVSDVKGEIHV